MTKQSCDDYTQVEEWMKARTQTHVHTWTPTSTRVCVHTYMHRLGHAAVMSVVQYTRTDASRLKSSETQKTTGANSCI
jgi:hypothetical protein